MNLIDTTLALIKPEAISPEVRTFLCATMEDGPPKPEDPPDELEWMESEKLCRVGGPMEIAVGLIGLAGIIAFCLLVWARRDECDRQGGCDDSEGSG